MSTSNQFARFAEEVKGDDMPVEVPVRDRHGEPYVGKAGNPIVFQVVGEYSRQYRQVERALLDKMIKRARRGDSGYDAEQSERAGYEKVAAGVTGWNMEDEAGSPIPFSRENVVAFFMVAPWVAREDIEPAIKGHSSFFKRASAS